MNPKERVLKVYPHATIGFKGNLRVCHINAGNDNITDEFERFKSIAEAETESECWENASKVIGLLPFEKTMLRSAIIKSNGLIDMIKISIKNKNELNLSNAICVLAVRSGLDKDLVRENINEIIEL